MRLGDLSRPPCEMLITTSITVLIGVMVLLVLTLAHLILPQVLLLPRQ
jgi:hypothetical protein